MGVGGWGGEGCKTYSPYSVPNSSRSRASSLAKGGVFRVISKGQLAHFRQRGFDSPKREGRPRGDGMTSEP